MFEPDIMPIFDNNRGRLREISEAKIELEKDIQKLVEENMNTVFNIDFVTSEFELDGLRVDSLGFDKDSLSFVIIEYKREKNISVIDQGYAYLALLLNNKAEFILIYNERTGTLIKRGDVDWSQSKVIFISPSFTTYQRKAVEFKDLPIELWEVKTYSNKTILFNQIQTPAKNESISKLNQRSELVRSVNREVKVYTEDTHLENRDLELKSTYRDTKEAILSIAANITIKPKAKYISFIHRKNFVDIVVWKSKLGLFLNMKKGSLNDPKKISRDVSGVGHWGNGDYEISVKNVEDLGYVLSLVRQSYEMN